MMLTLGIDPGLSGAWALLTADGEVEGLGDLPVMRAHALSWIHTELRGDLNRAIAGRPVRAIVEHVTAMPKQGVSTTFTFGMAVGSMLAIVQSLGIGIELVRPTKWKKALGLDREKKTALHRARLLFPTAELGLVKHHGRAEALLLAHWAIMRPRLPHES